MKITSPYSLLAELSPVPTIKTIACSHGRNMKMARELKRKRKYQQEEIVAVSEAEEQQRGITASAACICLLCKCCGKHSVVF
jgi:hypothetical protein